MLADKLRAATAAAASVEPVGIDFDGTNDYLSRSSDLVGNADGKTFTFSVWVWIEGDDQQYFYCSWNGGVPAFYPAHQNNGKMVFTARNSANTLILSAEVNPGYANKTWVHIVGSVNMTDPAQRSIYINDEAATVAWNIYTNDNINFTNATHTINSTNPSFAAGGSQRLAHVYLDYTYRDLSIEANRRLFITADGKPADGQAALNPILYLPLDDPEDPGRNDGTGGDFTLNGVVAQSGRGPNQYNAPASTFDGSNDYLSRSSITGISDGKVFTFSVSLKFNATGQFYAFSINNKLPFEIATKISSAVGTAINVVALNTSSSQVLNVSLSETLVVDRWYSIQISVNLANPAERHIFIDGVEKSPTWTTYIDDNIDMTQTNNDIGATQGGVSKKAGEISDLYFDTTYIDLSADNPFYDSETGKPKYLGASGELPTGSAPLIYLPLRADDAGSNKGTGGDFTVNSGPYTGARGPSEFWGESAEFNGTNQYLSGGALTGAADTKVVSFAVAVYPESATSRTVMRFDDVAAGGGTDWNVSIDGSNQLISITGRNTTSNTTVLNVSSASSSVPLNQWSLILVYFDLANASNRGIYVNGTSVSATWATYTDAQIQFSETDTTAIGAELSGAGGHFDGKIGFLWFNTEYIDFSQEANRLKFFDAFGYPVDLGEDGSLPTGNQPLIYMNNDFHLGNNLGSGGNFTPQNTPTDGGYVKG